MANTIESINEAVKEFLEASKIANPAFTPEKESITGLLTKVAKMWHLTQNFNDKLPEMDAEKMPYGGVLEEWNSMLANVEDYDPEGATTLAPRYLKYLPPSYSYLQPKKVVPVTRPYDLIQKACLDDGAYASLIGDISKRLEDTYALFKYSCKRTLLGKAVNAVDAAYTGAKTYAKSTAYAAGDYVKSGTDYYVITQNVTTAENGASATIDTIVQLGKAVKIDLRTIIGKPTDEATGEAFIKQIKTDAEIAQDINEGHSFNGGALGAEQGLVLYIKQGIMPSLDVDTLAGAFHTDRLAMPVEIKVLPDFGDGNDKAYAIMCDKRMFRVFPHYEATREQENGQGDFITYFRHFQHMYAYSRNAYIHVYEVE